MEAEKEKIGGIGAFDKLYELLLIVETPVMLPCILGIIAAMLFFMERDNGTLKNLRTVTIATALLYTTSILPAVIAIVGFNRSYIFSIILTFFYTMFGFAIGFTGQIFSSEPIMKLLTNVLPAPLIYRWQATQMIEQGTKAYFIWKPYLLPLWLVALVCFLIGLLSYLSIIKIYQKQES